MQATRKIQTAFVQNSKRILSRSGWKIEDNHAHLFNFRASKMGLALMVKCVDNTVVASKSYTRIVESLESGARVFKDKGVPSIFVMDTNFSSINFDNLRSREIIVLPQDELRIVGGVDRLLREIPSKMHPIEVMVASCEPSLAANLSDFYKKQGDIDSSLHWASLASEWGEGRVGVQIRLIELLRLVGKIERAEAVCEAALKITPNNAVLQNLAKQMQLSQTENQRIDLVGVTKDCTSLRNASVGFLLSSSEKFTDRYESSKVQYKNAVESSSKLKKITNILKYFVSKKVVDRS